MLPYFADDFGNASSIHKNGQAAKAAIEDARDSVAKLIGARASEVVFTSGGTEADNLAIFGMASPGDHIIASTIEHHAVLQSCRHAASLGCELTEIPVNGQGLIDPDDVRRALRPNTRLISIMLANNETGVLQPVEEIGKLARERDICFHSDGVQAAGKVPLGVSQLGCDLLSISGHKMHAPQGVGALYVRKGIRLRARLHGGAHERSRRAGTENVPGIAGLGKAAALAASSFDSDHDQKLCDLRDRLERGILDRVEDCQVNGGTAPRVPNTTNIQFNFVDGEAMVIALDLKGIAISSGAACSSGASEPSHVLTAMGLTAAQARSTVRLSLGKQNTAEDVDFVIDAVTQTVARLRDLSPNYRREEVRS
jgi:cysteine desulfurase